MSEMTDKKSKERKAGDPVPVETGPIDPIEESEELAGFDHQEIARLLKVKHEIAAGRYSDITNEHRKLLFVQWLIEHGKLYS